MRKEEIPCAQSALNTKGYFVPFEHYEALRTRTENTKSL